MGEKKSIIIDAKDQALGRISTLAAAELLGKSSPTFLRHQKEARIVEIINAAQIRFSGKKFAVKRYKRYSGYHSGLHEVKMSEQFLKNPASVVRKTIWGMLPKNRLRKQIIRNLRVKG